MTDKPNLNRVWASSAPGGNVVDPDITSPGKFTEGWVAEIPSFENFNFLQQLFTQGLLYLSESGIPDYDSSTDYVQGAVQRGSDGLLYVCEIDNGPSSTVVDPVGDVTGSWFPMANSICTQSEAEAGSNNVKAMTPLRTVQSIAENGLGGGDQSWVDATLSRDFNVTYTNTTGKPIKVSITTSNTVVSSTFSNTLFVDGLTISDFEDISPSGGVGYEIFTMQAIVPDGSTYRLEGTQSSLETWSELR